MSKLCIHLVHVNIKFEAEQKNMMHPQAHAHTHTHTLHTYTHKCTPETIENRVRAILAGIKGKRELVASGVGAATLTKRTSFADAIGVRRKRGKGGYV
jgi:hypothetical protein